MNKVLFTIGIVVSGQTGARHRPPRQFAEWHPPRCPQVLGIDQYFFTLSKGYATRISLENTPYTLENSDRR